MAFFSVIPVFILALPLFAVPNPSEHEARQSCNAGTLQCCADVTSLESVTSKLNLLGIHLDGQTVTIGFDCSPVIGVNSIPCSTNLVCCEDIDVGGVLGIGCVGVTK